MAPTVIIIITFVTYIINSSSILRFFCYICCFVQNLRRIYRSGVLSYPVALFCSSSDGSRAHRTHTYIVIPTSSDMLVFVTFDHIAAISAAAFES